MGHAEDGIERADVRLALAAASASALAVPAPELAAFVVTGKDRQTWLNGLVTCELAPLKDGDAAYGLFVEKKGKIVADVTVVFDSERLLLALPRAVAADVRAMLEHHLIMEDAEVVEGAFDVESVHGPRASEVLAAVRAAGAVGGALDPTGLGGCVYFVPAQSIASVREARDRALASVAGALGDDRAWEALRLERRVAEFGADFDAATYPQEAGLEKRAVSFSKGCYLGQEVVFMLEKRGHVKRLLVTLRVEGDAPPPRGAEVLDASGEAVGTVTSAAWVPPLGGPVAMAMVKRGKAEPGAVLVVGGSAATVLGAAG